MVIVAVAATGRSFGYHKRPDLTVFTMDFTPVPDETRLGFSFCDRNANQVPTMAIPDRNEINRKRTGHISDFSSFHFHEQSQRTV